MTRAGRLVLVALALAGWPVAAAPAAVTEPELVAPDPVAAMAVPIVGATGPEHVAAFAGLAAVPDAGVRKVVFFDQGRRRGLRVVLARSPMRPGADVREYWLANLVASAVAQPLESGDHPIRWVEVAPDGGGSAPGAETWPSRTPEELSALARDLATRAAEAGWEVVELRAWPTGAGAIAITLRLTERGLLDGRTDWQTTLFGGEWTYAHLLRIEAPDGSLLQGGGTIGTNGGFSIGPSTDPHASPPPAGLAGPTHLELAVTDPAYDNGPERRFAFTLDCDGGPSSGIADAPALCAHLVADRYALLAPVASDGACSGIVGAPSMSLAGTFLGVAVQRGFSSCSVGATQRWMELLRIPPAAAYVELGDAYSTAAIPIVGGTRAERRAARKALTATTYGQIGRVTFGRRNGHRVIDVAAHADAANLGLPEADASWLAGEVRREIVRRLAGQDTASQVRGGAYRRLQSRGDTLLSRARRAGWYARSVRGWNLRPGGAFVVTLRLTERELLEGRTGWLQDLAPDRRSQRYVVRFDVEAPDGTLIAGGGETLPIGHAGPPIGIEGATRLELDANLLPAERRTLVLDCDGGPSTGVADPAAACARLVADRYALLAPLERPECTAAGLGESVKFSGTFRGVPIDRFYGACAWRIKDRWLRLLGVA